MIQRKHITTVILLLLAMSLCAQTAKYTEILNKAKNYEDDKEWCYALGYYYDAMVEDPANAEDALRHYTLIRDTIKAGKPGLGNYNDYTMYGGWISLLQNTEKYWTEFCPEYFTFGEIEKGAVDLKTQTTSYSISINNYLSAKYNNIQGIIEEGYKVAYRANWTDMPQDWPTNSIFSASDGTMQKDTALYIKGSCASPAWSFGKQQYYDDPVYGLYDLRFSIYGENGMELLKSENYLEGTYSYWFDKVPVDVMAVIDAGKVTPKLTAVFLNYGIYNAADDTGERGFVKHFQKLAIPLEQNEKNIVQREIDDITGWVACARKQKLLDTYEPVVIDGMGFVRGLCKLTQNEDSYGRKINTKITVENFYMATTEVTQSQYEEVMGNNPSNFIGPNHPADFIGPNHPVENVSWYDAVDYCNKRSTQEGLTPCYSGSGDTMQCDFNVNGYRLPTQAEWEYAAKGGRNELEFYFAGSSNGEEVAWYGVNSGRTTHDVATKKANTLGIYDMTGNVCEWCWDALRSWRILRGGSCFDDIYVGLYCSVYNSDSSMPSDYLNGTGFRVVRSAQGIIKK